MCQWPKEAVNRKSPLAIADSVADSHGQPVRGIFQGGDTSRRDDVNRVRRQRDLLVQLVNGHLHVRLQQSVQLTHMIRGELLDQHIRDANGSKASRSDMTACKPPADAPKPTTGRGGRSYSIVKPFWTR